MAEAAGKQISCRFVTKLSDEYRVPPTEIAVPANLTRYGLSQVVNHLLGREEAVPFDFLVNGELVRLSLGKLLLLQNASTESVLEIEYFFAITPPEHKQQLPHDDWVSAVLGNDSGEILSGCYDGLLRVWNGEGQLQGTAPIHRGPVSAIRGIPTAKAPLVLSAGKLDHVIRMLQVPPGAARKIGTLAIYKGHQGSVHDVAAAPSGRSFVSASQDRTLRIWPTGDETAEEARAAGHGQSGSKKQKLADGSAAAVGGLEVSHAAELRGHTDAVTSAAWDQSGRIVSGSMDHSVRRWDAETGTHVETFNDRKAIACVAVPPGGRDIVAFGGASKSIQLWDPRKRQAEDAAPTNYLSHKSHVHALAWHPTSENHLVSASMDKTLKLWDLRSGIPLHTLEGHSDQVLCAAWWGGRTIVSGGADKCVRIFKTEEAR